MNVDDVIDVLGYRHESDHWVTEDDGKQSNAHLLRLAKQAAVVGSYMYRASPGEHGVLPAKPAIHVAVADSVEEARYIHKRLWNLGTAPFVAVVLPNQVRIYSGFNYDPKDDQAGYIAGAQLDPQDIARNLEGFFAEQIDSGRIWQVQAANISTDRRVDQRLLKNLRELGAILNTEKHIDATVAHALIGKYIYIRYLCDRGIITDAWLKPLGITFDQITGRNATLASLGILVTALEDRFNGGIFPLPFTGSGAPTDAAVGFVAAVFRGDEAQSGQIALDFPAYDFSYIPIELLSSIYEHFLHSQGHGREEGAYYTHEYVADYLLCELNSIKPLRRGMRVLDPACGSGVFLVLAYRRLIEIEMRYRKTDRLTPRELKQVLEKSIYGVERSEEACRVAEFSLILTLLSYIEPPDLQRNAGFRLPDLHNQRIFQCDFFDDKSIFSSSGLTFDWIVGNPPWIKLDSRTAPDVQPHIWNWIAANSKSKPVGQYSTSEAFTWRVPEYLNRNGHAGLLTHATSLFNENSVRYRQAFFSKHDVRRITNFANLAYLLFAGSAKVAAATLIYRIHNPSADRPPIIHFGPLVTNQVLSRSFVPGSTTKSSWAITIYEDEICNVNPLEAEDGNALTWKVALWGTYRDDQALRSLKRLFPLTLDDFMRRKNWELHQGLALCPQGTPGSRPLPKQERSSRLNVGAISGDFYLEVPQWALEDIPPEDWYTSSRAGDIGLRVSKAPHVFWTTGFAAYSDIDFVLPKPQVGLAAPKNDAELLRALTLYFNSSVARYLLFFHSTLWGVDRTRILPADVKRLPLPDLSKQQEQALASLYHSLPIWIGGASQSSMFSLGPASSNPWPAGRISQNWIDVDSEMCNILGISEHNRVIAQEFDQIRYQFIQGKVGADAIRRPDAESLARYAQYLRRELDEFAGVHHKVTVRRWNNLIACTAEISNSRTAIEPVIHDQGGNVPVALSSIWEAAGQQFSQWVYVRRGLRVFEGKRVHVIKPDRLVDWSLTQALMDSDDIIAETLQNGGAS